VVHPYRDASDAIEERGSEGLDAEDLAVHGVIALVGAFGVLVGAAHSRSTELVLGGMMTLFAARRLVSALCDRWRANARIGVRDRRS
jgi:hypothetical protein